MRPAGFAARRRALRRAVACALLLAAAGCGAWEPAPDESAAASDGALARVLRVSDGDTIRVRLRESGARERVRYIGVDTPELAGGGECFARAATDRNRALVDRREVRLVYDAERRDRYGRLLAYVTVAGRDVGAALLREGYAVPLRVEPNVARSDSYHALARRARHARLGLWGAC